MIDAVQEGWGWKGIQPDEVIRTNAFGNVLVRDGEGRVWRICPEDLGCSIVAETDDALRALLLDPAFLRDWEMQRMVDEAASHLGALDQDHCYCLKIPAVLGGSYEGENLATISRDELIRASGAIAQQIENLPDGAKVTLKVVE